MKTLKKLRKVIVTVIIATFLFITTTMAQGTETNSQVVSFPKENYLCNSYLVAMDKQSRLMNLAIQDKDYIYLSQVVDTLIYYNRQATVECQTEEVQTFLKSTRPVLKDLKDKLDKAR